MPGWTAGSSRDRRRAPRRVPDAGEPLARLRLRTGRELDVIDLSSAGALVEGSARLLPGTHADVHVVTREGRVLVRSRIVRAYVCQVVADAIRYRGALAFEQAVDVAPAGYGLPSGPPWPLAAEGSSYPGDIVLEQPNGDSEPQIE